DDELLAKQSDYFKHVLKYCVACIPWKGLMDKQIKSFEQLHNFIKKIFGHLYDIIKKNELNYSLYKFIKTDHNEERIKLYYGPFMNLQLWTSTMEEFDQFEILQQNFLKVSSAYNMNLSYETEIFYNSLKKWEYCTLANIHKANDQILQLLKRFAKELQLMIDRKDSVIFRNLWNEYVKEPESALIRTSMLAEYPHKTFKRKLSICKDIVERISFEAYMSVFESANQTWEHLSKAIKNNTLQFADARWFENANWKLEMDILVPEMKQEKVDKALQSKMEQTEKAGRLETANKGWTALKRATQTIQKFHKEKSSIRQDRTWQDFEEKLAAIDEMLCDKQNVVIENAAKLYDTCTDYVGDATKHIAILQLIYENEQALKALEDSKQQDFYPLAESLRQMHLVMSEYIWKVHFETFTSLAMALLKLPDDTSNFASQLESSLTINCSQLLPQHKTSISSPAAPHVFKDVRKIGKWVFEDCRIICERQNHEEAKEEKKEEMKNAAYEGLTLQIGKKNLSCEEVGCSIDRSISDRQRPDVEAIVYQFGICKEIYSLRMDYWEKGGRSNTSLFELAVDNVTIFETRKKKIKELLGIWKKECRRLRKSYFGLTYFTMNEAQNLIQSFDSICSLDDQHLSLLASKLILPFLQRLNWSLQDVLPMVRTWKRHFKERATNSDNMSRLEKLGDIVTKVWEYSENNKNAPNKDLELHSLRRGRPNLFLSKHGKELNLVVDLFKSLSMIPRTEHVLICKETTTEEEIECMLLRVLHCTLRSDKTPLYCLVWPEKLRMEVLSKVVQLFQGLLLTSLQSRATSYYVLAVVSSDECNDLARSLQNYKWNVDNSIYNVLDIGQSMGKTWTIKYNTKTLRQNTIKHVEEICVRFNSSDIDWEQTVHILWQYYLLQEQDY
ncbi:hypothetical protein RFI_22774, partial [Reticulomyxa filosa]